MPLHEMFDRVMIRTRSASNLVKVAGTVVVVGFFALARMAADPIWPSGYPFILAFISVIASVTLFNQGMGFLATMLTALFAMYFYLPPDHSFAVEGKRNVLAVAVYCFTGILATLLIETLHQSLEKLRESERIRVALLKEFRHRTRNDLQSLVGMITLRARATHSPEAQLNLKAVADHAIAMSVIHNHLINATPGDGQEAVIEARRFILGLCKDIERAHRNRGGFPISVVAESISYQINTERAVQVGLIISEVVGTALKYSFPDSRAGHVRVNLERTNGEFALRIEDNGVGINLLSEERDGGLLSGRLLKALAAQLRGHLTRHEVNEGGTSLEVRFPVLAPTIIP